MTAKLKLHTDPVQFVALPTTQLAYRDALNSVSQYAFEHGKMSNRVALQDGTYDEVRARFHPDSKANGGLTVEAKQRLRRIGVTAGDGRHIRQRKETVVDPQVDGLEGGF